MSYSSRKKYSKMSEKNKRKQNLESKIFCKHLSKLQMSNLTFYHCSLYNELAQ